MWPFRNTTKKVSKKLKKLKSELHTIISDERRDEAFYNLKANLAADEANAAQRLLSAINKNVNE